VLSVYRIEPEEHACAPFLTPFEMTIPLDVLGLEDGQTLAGLTAIEANGLSYFVQTTDAGTQLLPAERDFLQVDSRSVRDSVLSITGTLSDGCDAVLGVLGRQRDDKPVFDVWVYRLLLVEDAERMCPAVLQEHTVTYTFPEDLAPNVYTYNINDGQATGAFVKEEVTVQTMLEERIQRVLHGIDAASASVNADGILILNVTGYIPDGCEALARVNVSQEDTVITVEIYREIPPGIMCPQMIVDYSDSVELGEFPSGDYTIRVNGLEIAFSF
jgi:hypothetical protein